MKINLENISKILLVRLDALGDTLLSTPLIEALKEEFSQSKIDCLASERGESALKNNPCLNKILVLNYQKSKLSGKISLANFLFKEKYDMGINLTEKIWGYFFIQGAKIKIGFYPGFFQPFKSLMISPFLNLKVKHFNMHEVERQFMLLKTLGVRRNPGKLKIYLKEKIFKEIPFKGENIIALQLSKKWFNNTWSKDFLKELIFEILKKENFKILITYGKEEEKIGKNFIKNFSSGIIDWGCKDFEFWAGGLSFCKVLITMDSGASHLASALNIPVIDIFEERDFKINSKRWYPWDVKHFLLKRPSFDKNSRFKKEIVDALLKVLNYG